MTSLASLSSAILGAILSYNGTSSAALRLWISGSRALQSRLAAGITRIKLVNATRHNTNRWPSILADLRTLRELTIDRDMKTLMYHTQWPYEVQKLPPTLRKLRLCIRDSKRVLSPAPSTTPHETADPNQASCEHVSWTFKNAFPQLESLELHVAKGHLTAHDFSLLPPTITHLAIQNVPFTDCESLMSQLPPQLLSLKVVTVDLEDPDASFWTRLPPNLTALKIYGAIAFNGDVDAEEEEYNRSKLQQCAEIAEKLPRSLTHITTSFHEFMPSLLTLLPPSLTELETQDPYDSEHQGPLDVKTVQHFPNLKTLKTGELPLALLRALPSGIKHIRCCTNDSSITPEDWPKSLETLEIRKADTSFPLSILPHYLTSFQAVDNFKLDMALVSLLPRTLRSLTCDLCIMRDEADFPPNLTYLSLGGTNDTPSWLELEPEADDEAINDDDESVAIDYESATYHASLNGRKVVKCFPFHCLPQSLVDFNVELFLPASKLKYLPRCLSNLAVEDIFEDADFDGESAAEMEAMRSIFEMGAREGVREKIDWTFLKQASIPALIPRTLRRLAFAGNAIAYKADWSLIPPRIEKLWLGLQKGMPAHWISQLPLDYATELRLTLDQPTDEHIKSIPRHINRVRVLACDESQLTRKAAIFTPPGSVYHGCLFNYELDWLYAELEAKRIELATQDNDRSLYLRLISGDESVLEMFPEAPPPEDDDDERLM